MKFILSLSITESDLIFPLPSILAFDVVGMIAEARLDLVKTGWKKAEKLEITTTNALIIVIHNEVLKSGRGTRNILNVLIILSTEHLPTLLLKIECPTLLQDEAAFWHTYSAPMTVGKLRDRHTPSSLQYFQVLEPVSWLFSVCIKWMQ